MHDMRVGEVANPAWRWSIL